MNITTINTNNETTNSNILELPEGTMTSGYMYNEDELDSPETLEAVETMIASQIEENSMPPMNRAQRRAFAKKLGKSGRERAGLIGETARKLNYIDLIQKLKKINEENKKENYNNENVAEEC